MAEGTPGHINERIFKLMKSLKGKASRVRGTMVEGFTLEVERLGISCMNNNSKLSVLGQIGKRLREIVKEIENTKSGLAVLIIAKRLA